MKKIIQICLISSFSLLLIVSGCSNNQAIKDRYQVEKSFHFAEKEFEQVRQITGNLTKNQLAHFEKIYSELYDNSFDAMKSADSVVTPVEYNELIYLTYRIGVRLNQFLFSQNKYYESIEMLSSMISDIPIDESLKSPMYINLGQLQLSVGNLDSALSIYDYCIEKFYPPLDQTNEIDYPVFNLPWTIVNLTKFVNKNRIDKRAFEKAKSYYNRLIDEFPDTKLSISSHTNLAKLYEDNQEYEKELEQLAQIIKTDSPGYYSLRLKTASILINNLNRYDEALQIYNELQNETEATDSIRIAQLYYYIADLKMKQGKYSEVREQLTKIERFYPLYYTSSPEIKFLLAKSYELDNNWELAKPEFNLLIEKFRDSEQAINALIYLNGHFKTIGRIAEANQWYQLGIEHLTKLAAEAPGTYTEARAYLGLANLYYNNDEWQKSVDILLNMFYAYPTTKPGRMAGIRASNIYRENLNSPAKADSILNDIKTSYSSFKDSDEPLNLLE